MAKQLVKKQTVLVKKPLTKVIKKTSEKKVLLKKESPEVIRKEKIDFNKLQEVHLVIYSPGRLKGREKTLPSDRQQVFLSHDDLDAIHLPLGGYLESAKAFSGMVEINHKDREETMVSRHITISAATMFALMQTPTRKFNLKEWSQLSTFRKLQEVANEYSEGYGVDITPGY